MARREGAEGLGIRGKGPLPNGRGPVALCFRERRGLQVFTSNISRVFRFKHFWIVALAVAGLCGLIAGGIPATKDPNKL